MVIQGSLSLKDSCNEFACLINGFDSNLCLEAKYKDVLNGLFFIFGLNRIFFFLYRALLKLGTYSQFFGDRRQLLLLRMVEQDLPVLPSIPTLVKFSFSVLFALNLQAVFWVLELYLFWLPLANIPAMRLLS